MRSLRGLHEGTPIRVIGGGKHGRGTIVTEPEPGATHLEMRCYFNGGQHLVPLEKVRAIQGPRASLYRGAVA